MKKQIYTALTGLFTGAIIVFILKKTESTGMKYTDFLPIFGAVVYISYQNYQALKKQSDSFELKLEGIENNHIVSIDNFLISKSKTENNLILVRNELFWMEEKEYANSSENILMENMIRDFKKLIECNKNFRQKMESNDFQFSLIDNVNYDNKIIAQKRVNYDKL